MELGIAFASVAYKYNAKYHFFLFSFIIFLNISLFFAYEVFKTSTRKTDRGALRSFVFFSYPDNHNYYISIYILYICDKIKRNERRKPGGLSEGVVGEREIREARAGSEAWERGTSPAGWAHRRGVGASMRRAAQTTPPPGSPAAKFRRPLRDRGGGGDLSWFL